MSTNETYHTDLITRYLTGEASQEEISQLSAWIQDSPENASLFRELRKTWLGVTADQVEQQVDMGKEFEALLPKLKGFSILGEGHRAQSSGHRAQGAGLRAQGIEHRAQGTGSRITGKKRQHPASRSEAEIPPMRDGIRHPESQRKPKVVPMESTRLPWQAILIRASLIAAIALVLLIPTWVAYRYFTRADMIRVMASGEILETQLPDGTTVSLNAFSSLSYSEDFGKKNRDIELNGDGYFEVTRDSLLPFTIHCGSSRLEVLGTSFYVDAVKEAGNMQVILVDGSITVYFEEARSSGKTIIPGEKAELNQANQQIVITPNEDPNFLAWKTRHLIFLDDRLDMIVRTLNNVYQTEITLSNENLASCHLTATFDQQSLESVLSVIQVTLGLQSENTPSGIILYGNGCN